MKAVTHNTRISIFMLCAVVMGLLASARSQTPYTTEKKIDDLAFAMIESDHANSSYIGIGLAAVPIVNDKLRRSLAERGSTDDVGEKDLNEMPDTDRKRAEYQSGLIIMEGLALQQMALSQEMKQSVLNVLYQALHSHYKSVRTYAIHYVAVEKNVEIIDHILPLLNDPDVANRDKAAEMLGKIGDRATAEKIETILQKRREKLAATGAKKDLSFQRGEETIKKLRESTSN